MNVHLYNKIFSSRIHNLKPKFRIWMQLILSYRAHLSFLSKVIGIWIL
jgi:hypothetical protein